MKRTEVTVGEYPEYANSGAAPVSDPELPITGISWDQAEAYCKSTGGRLPTEAEWEYAARAGTTGRFYGRLDDIAWFGGDTPDSAPQKVALKVPNAFGLYDMLGNVAEWVNDWYDAAYYGISPRDNPQGPSLGGGRVVRGGSFLDGSDLLRVSRRDSRPPSATPANVGFRCVQNP
jgi:formylglycine-generating enzyme required for sulfatase activity